MKATRVWVRVSFLLATLGLPIPATAEGAACADGTGVPDQTGVAVDPTTGNWCFDGVLMNAGSRVEGLAMNVRAANAIVDDANPGTADRWDYPGGIANDVWDGLSDPGAARNTAEFVAALPSWASYGLDMVTVGLQGGHPRFKCADSSGLGNRSFSVYDDLTDDLSAAADERLRSVVAAAWAHGIVVNVQLFYQNADTNEPNTDEEIIATIRNVTNRLEALATTPQGPSAPDGFQNIVIELANEAGNADTYGAGETGTTALDPVNHESRIREIHQEWPSALVTVNLGNSIRSGELTNEQNDSLQRELDWASIHGNIISASTLTSRVTAGRTDPDLQGKPVVVTEDLWSTEGDGPAAAVAPLDDGFDLNPNLVAAIDAGAGWGYYEQGCEGGLGDTTEEYEDDDPGEPARNHYRNGFQSLPVNWSPTSGDGAKQDFFTDVAVVTSSAPADTTAPSVPAGLVATVVSPTRIDLDWDASTDDVGVVGYDVWRDTTLLASTAATAWVDDTAAPDTTSTYTVVARDAAGNASDPSQGVVVTTPAPADTTAPSVPAGLVATVVSPTRIDLDWNASTDDVGVVGYDVWRDTTLLASTAATAWVDDTAAPDTTSTYTVVARDAAGNASDPSQGVVVTTPAPADTTAPSVPAGLVATVVSPTRIDLDWNASTDDVGVVGYDVWRDTTLLASTAATAWVDDTAAPDTTSTYTVVARDAAGNASGPSQGVVVTTPAPADTTAPSVPAGLVATVVSPTRIDLDWNASTDDVGVVGYDVWRDTTLLASTAATAWVDDTAAPDTTSTYTVVARDAAGNASDPSQGVVVTTPAPADTTAPSVPAGLVATVVSPTRIDLDWNASTDDVGVVGYDVWRDTTLLASTAATAWVDDTAAPDTTSTYTVVARDAAGNASDPSQGVVVTTPAPEPWMLVDGFESGSLGAAWFDVRGVTVQTQQVSTGSFAARAVSTGTPTYAVGSLPEDAMAVTYAASVRVDSQAKKNATLLAVQTSTGSPVISLYRAGSGRLGFRNHVTATNVNSKVSLPLGAWRQVVLRVVVAGEQGQVEVWFDGSRIGTLSKTQNTGTTPIRRVQFAETAPSVSHALYVDDLSVTPG